MQQVVGDLGEALQMDYGEFQDTFIKFAVYLHTGSQKGKTKSVADALDNLIQKVFFEAPQRLRLTVN